MNTRVQRLALCNQLGRIALPALAHVASGVASSSDKLQRQTLVPSLELVSPPSSATETLSFACSRAAVKWCVLSDISIE